MDEIATSPFVPDEVAPMLKAVAHHHPSRSPHRVAAPFPVIACLVVVAGALGSPGLSAQANTPPSAATSDEAAQARAEAREAQRAFEDARRSHLPLNSQWRSGECDTRVGRLCWRYHELLRWHPRSEPREVTTARDSLLAALGRAAVASPGDPWVLGQRVWTLAETGRIEEARSLAFQCGGAPLWWCSALEGLALHVGGRYAEAERAFDRALRDMDPDEARRWTDVSPLVDGDTDDLLEEAADRSPEDRDALLRRLWMLADPLYLVPGNDRRTEHLARRTLIRILSEAATPYDVPWGEDMAELLLRYGWDRGWERVSPLPGELGGIMRVVGYEDPDVRSFLPPATALASDGAAEGPEPWTPSMWALARSGYAPEYAPVFLPMSSRVVVLTRGTHALVAATFDLPPDTTWRTREGVRTLHLPPPGLLGWPEQAGLVLAQSDRDLFQADTRDGVSRGVAVVDVPAGNYIASVEVLDPVAGRAGRLRETLQVPQVPPRAPVLSDLLVMEGDSLAGDAREALQRLRIDDEAVSGERLAVAWELWGLGFGPVTLDYRLSLEAADRGLLGRFRDLVGGSGSLLLLQWQEPGPDQPGAALQGRSLTLPELEPGAYTLTLEVTLPGREPLVSRQRLRIVEGGGGGGGDRP